MGWLLAVAVVIGAALLALAMNDGPADSPPDDEIEQMHDDWNGAW